MVWINLMCVVVGIRIHLKDTYEFVSLALGGFNKNKFPCGPKLEFDHSFVSRCISGETIEYGCQDTAVLSYLWNVQLPEWYSEIENSIARSRFQFKQFMSQAHIAYNIVLHGCDDVRPIFGSHYEYGKHCYFGAKVDSMFYGMDKSNV